MEMTRQHFEMIAETLKATRPSVGWVRERLSWANTVGEFAYRLCLTNPAFDPDEFRDACGLREET